MVVAIVLFCCAYKTASCKLPQGAPQVQAVRVLPHQGLFQWQRLRVSRCRGAPELGAVGGMPMGMTMEYIAY